MNTGEKPNSDGGEQFGCSASEFPNRIRMLKTFGDRVRFVIGAEQWTPWAIRHGIAPSTVDGWLHKGVGPYKKTLTKLEEATGIPAAWWKSGEGPPPTAADVRPQVQRSGVALAPDVAPSPPLSRGEPHNHLSPQAHAPSAPLEVRQDRAPYANPNVSKLLLRLAVLIGQLDWIPADLGLEEREQLAEGAARAALASSGADPAPLYRLMDSPAALEAALRLHWEATRAQRPAPPDASA